MKGNGIVFVFYVFRVFFFSIFLISCSTEENELEQREPHLYSMSILASDNPDKIVKDGKCYIVGDSVIDIWIKNNVKDKIFKYRINYEGEKVTFNDLDVESGGIYDFSKPVNMTLFKGVCEKKYRILVHSFTGLPVVYIETNDRMPILSKEDYVDGTFKLVEDVHTRGAGDIIEVTTKIKGHGNSTWTSWKNYPKKPYRLKFDEKISLFDEPKDKSWVLLANYIDKTMLRNALAFYMGEVSNIEYTPRFHFVELFLNGQFKGTYQLVDKLKISKHRVNVGDDGFLLEFDQRAPQESDSRCFSLNHHPEPINIKEPDVEIGDENYCYIKDVVLKAESVLFSDSFKDKNEGWQKYMDINSFVDWYLIEEISKSRDGTLWSSCYMNYKRGDKLKLGPIWDFDISFGNSELNDRGNEASYDDYYVKQVKWFSRLFEDPTFVCKVKERFDFFYSKREDFMQYINDYVDYLQYSIVENDNCWNTLNTYVWPNYYVLGDYYSEVQAMKDWMLLRMDWLKNEFDKM